MLVAVKSLSVAVADPARVVLWGAIMVAAVVVLGGGVLWLRRRLFRRPAAGEDAGFSIEHLEELHRCGQIDDAEFRRLRNAALGLGPPGAEKPDRPSSPPCDADDE